MKPAKPIAAPVSKSGLPCPACGAMLVMSPTLRRKKVQCPKCREIIVLPDATAEPEPAGASESAAPVPGGPDPSEDRAARMEARIHLLERDVAALQELIRAFTAGGVGSGKISSEPMAEDVFEAAEAVAPTAPPPETAPPVFRDWRAMAAQSQPAPPAVPAKIAPAPRALEAPWPDHPVEAEPSEISHDRELVEGLEGLPAGKIAIRPTSEDSATLGTCTRLQRLFSSAGWTVMRLDPAPAKIEHESIVLVTTSQLPSPKIATTIHRAFSQAGLALAFEIDPTGDSPIPLLLVPRQRAQIPRTEPPEGRDTPGGDRPALTTFPPPHGATEEYSLFRPQPIPAKIAS